MPESFTSRLKRWGFNFFPAYRASGARLTYLADDFREVHIALPLRRRTRNYVGTIYGGAMFSAVDPIYMVMLINLLGRDYVVWDKAATIRYLRPGRSTLKAVFRLPDEELRTIRDALTTQAKVERLYQVRLEDETGTVCAEVDKVLHIRHKNPQTADEGAGQPILRTQLEVP